MASKSQKKVEMSFNKPPLIVVVGGVVWVDVVKVGELEMNVLLSVENDDVILEVDFIVVTDG